MKASRSLLHDDLQRLSEGRHHAPLSLLGCHPLENDEYRVRAWLPFAESCRILETHDVLDRIEGTDFFEARLSKAPPRHYQLAVQDKLGNDVNFYDPYSFSSSIPEFDLNLFSTGKHQHIYRILGAHCVTIDTIQGVRFAVWAPNAERVSLVGDFNGWDGRVHPMESRGQSGVWEIFIPNLAPDTLYKFEIRNRQTGEILTKSDPYARSSELRPDTASRVVAPIQYRWHDNDWLEKRTSADWQHSALSIYEVHLGSWKRDPSNWYLGYRDYADQLVEYVLRLGFTHIELLPVSEYPLDASWGYQVTGYYAPSSRFGNPDDFRYLIDQCHAHGLGVILDWVPGHFPKDAHGLARFDGHALYEHEDPRRGEHRDWGTLIFDYGRDEVRNFLISNALYWMDEFHIDGLRVDAVASMLYLDYSREDGDWLPNIHGGRENLDAIEFLRELNSLTHELHPGTLMIAEESTSWPQVSRPVFQGGLGFSMKWNMGWMHDILEYFQNDPVHRKHHHDKLTFGMLYAFTENFVLPFSHDEVVHGKSSMINKMPGDEWQRFANLRTLYAFMFTYPGKKLLFMGSEFGQTREWQEDSALDWSLLDYGLHTGLQHLIKDLNHLYTGTPELYQFEFEQSGFQWIDCHSADQSVISYERISGDKNLVVLINLTPVPREHFRVGVSADGHYEEIMNTDSSYYGGSNLGNGGTLQAESIHINERLYSVSLTLPPLGAIILRHSSG